MNLHICAAFQNVSCFVFEQSIVFHNAALQNIYNVFYFKTSSVFNFNTVKKQSGIGFIVDALFDNFTYLHSLYTFGGDCYQITLKNTLKLYYL